MFSVFLGLFHQMEIYLFSYSVRLLQVSALFCDTSQQTGCSRWHTATTDQISTNSLLNDWERKKGGVLDFGFWSTNYVSKYHGFNRKRFKEEKKGKISVGWVSTKLNFHPSKYFWFFQVEKYDFSNARSLNKMGCIFPKKRGGGRL